MAIYERPPLTTFLERLKDWFHESIVPGHERLRWIKNDKLPARVELRDLLHAFETEENRMEMLGYYMSVFYLLHLTEILVLQFNRSHRMRFTLKGTAVAHLPIGIQELMKVLHEKVMSPAPFIAEA